MGRFWTGIPEKESVQDSLSWPGCKALLEQLVQENLLCQVQVEPGWNAGLKEYLEETVWLGMLDGQASAFGPVQPWPHLSTVKN